MYVISECCRTWTHNHIVCKRTLIWAVCLNGWVFFYKLSGCRFESCCCYLNFRYEACFKQGVSWYSGKYRVWIHSETHNDMLKAYSYVCYLVIVVIFMGNGGAKLFYQGKPQRALEATCITSQWTYSKIKQKTRKNKKQNRLINKSALFVDWFNSG